MMFRELSPAEVAEFKQWARDNFTAGDTIEASIWHPVIVAECEAINSRAESIKKAVVNYIRKLKTDSPIVSTSHWTYGKYFKMFGEDFDKALNAHFARHGPNG